MSPSREAYWRATMTVGTTELILGVELRDGDDMPALRTQARHLLEAAAEAGGNEKAVAESIERMTWVYWPGRAYFIEVAHDGDDGWVQIYDPRGPK